MNRRDFHVLAGVTLAAWSGRLTAAADEEFATLSKSIEAGLGGRLGISGIDIGSGRRFGHRADERFPMCSTFKWLAAASVLDRIDRGLERLDRRIRFDEAELLEWSPSTRMHAGGAGMTVGDLCEAAIVASDNTAAHLLLRESGGIAGWNRYLRSIGDRQSRLDRGEPLLNEARPGDVRDTTTPAAMVADLRRLILEDRLSPASREQLTRWMLATKTSDRRLRAGLPAGWRLADKTGTGNTGTGTVADVGVLWPPSGAPFVLAVYVTRARVSPAEQEAAIARVGRWTRGIERPT